MRLGASVLPVPHPLLRLSRLVSLGIRRTPHHQGRDAGDLPRLLETAGLSRGPVLVLVGGSWRPRGHRQSPADFPDPGDLVPVVVRVGASVVDGGTDAGVMRAMGARSDADAPFQLVGVAAAGTVPSPGDGDTRRDGRRAAPHPHRARARHRVGGRVALAVRCRLGALGRTPVSDAARQRRGDRLRRRPAQPGGRTPADRAGRVRAYRRRHRLGGWGRPANARRADRRVATGAGRVAGAPRTFSAALAEVYGG